MDLHIVSRALCHHPAKCVRNSFDMKQVYSKEKKKEKKILFGKDHHVAPLSWTTLENMCNFA